MPKKKTREKQWHMSSATTFSPTCTMEVKVRNTKTGQIKQIKQYNSRVDKMNVEAFNECPECGERYCLGAGRVLGDWVELERPLRPIQICQKCACKITGVPFYEGESKNGNPHKGFKKNYYQSGSYRESANICKFVEPLYKVFLDDTEKDEKGWFEVSNGWIKQKVGCRYATELLSLMQKVKCIEIVRGKGNERKIRVLGSENHEPILKKIMNTIEETTDEKTGFSSITNKAIGERIGTQSVSGFIDHLIKQGYLDRAYNPKKGNVRLLKIKRRYE